MFCDSCGRLLNRATGRCVCADDPSLATPPPALVASASGGVATAVLERPVVVTARPEPIPEPAMVAARPIEARVRGVITDLRSGLRRYDLRIHDDGLVLS